MSMKVFLSFRNDDTGDFAQALHDFITYRLHFQCDVGGKDIVPGTPWRDSLAGKIAEAHVFIPVIGSAWEFGSGNRNICDKNDVIRFEIEQALSSTKRVLPLLVDRPALKPEDLPESLRPLTEIHSVMAHAPFVDHRGLSDFVATLRQIADELEPKPIVLLSSTLAFFEDRESMEGL